MQYVDLFLAIFDVIFTDMQELHHQLFVLDIDLFIWTYEVRHAQIRDTNDLIVQ